MSHNFPKLKENSKQTSDYRHLKVNFKADFSFKNTKHWCENEKSFMFLEKYYIKSCFEVSGIVFSFFVSGIISPQIISSFFISH